MPHECSGCGGDCECIEGAIVVRNCVGCGDCDDILDDEDDAFDEEGES